MTNNSISRNCQQCYTCSEFNSRKQSSGKDVPEHLKSIFENISKSLTGSQIEQIKDLLIAYQDIFMGPDGKLGRTGLVKLLIEDFL